MKSIPRILCCTTLLSLTAFGTPTERIYLSGVDFENPVEWDFMVTGGMRANEWGKIGVPSQWELQGYGEYTYGRWYKEKGVDHPSMEEGYYRYMFPVATELKGKIIDIVFGGVMTDTEVKINGKSAGLIHQGGFYQFKYRITDLVKYGENNLLEVHVKKHSENRSINAAERMADWWLFGGIYRPVWLDIKPQAHIEHVAVDAKADGSLRVDIQLENLNQDAHISAGIISLDKAHCMLEPQLFNVKKGETTVSLDAKWDGIKPWSPEDPNLYELTLQLTNGDDILHQVTKRIGFRTLEFKRGDGIYVNGVKTIFKGINRHSFWPEGGRSTTEAISRMDANILKDMNINAVRSHYPPDEHFLDMCDELGLYYLDELAGWQNCYDDEIGAKLVKEMVERDVNHPCIVIWDNGNEGGWNYNTDKLFSRYDPQQRIVIHPWADFDGWDAHHYPAYQTGVHRFNNGENVFFPAETMHGMYDQGHGAGLQDFWAKWTTSPLFAGAFIWAYNDCAVLRTDWTGEKKYDSNRYMAPDGIVGPHREKEGSVFAVKEIWAPIQFEPRRITSSFDGSFVIKNTYQFSNLNTCRMAYQLLKIDSDGSGPGKLAAMKTGSIEIPDIQPGESRKIHMDVPDNFYDNDVLSITAWDPHGREIYTWTWPIHRAAEYAKKYVHSDLVDSIFATAVEDENTATLKASNVSVTFDKASGCITSVKNGGTEIPLNNGPIPVGMKADVVGTQIRQDGIHAILEVDYNGGIDNITWTMTADGLLKMDMLCLNKGANDGGFDGSAGNDFVNEFGVTFDYPEEKVKGMQWFGRGPYRVWKNRIPGTSFGLWDKDYNNTITGESFETLIYPEFKGYHANVFFAKMRTDDGPIGFYTENDNLFLRMLTPEEPEGRDSGRNTMPAFPPGDISFLYEIGAIQSFKPLAHQGPHSQPSSIRIKVGDEGIRMKIWFDFR
ncbi:MAG: hypothetical protein JXR25_16895 [Pontiellaceae bacterium]|nr:hypothetical protein [Pontiellaceae bacterium]MBN2786500.1 hypothetical protein [Pontiellaceae bacterium]